MKSEHRRELHANELEKLTQSIGRFFEKHGLKVVIGLVAVILATVGTFWWWSSRHSNQKKATEQILNATLPGAEPGAGVSVESLLGIADNRRGTKVGAVARLQAAFLLYDQGKRLYLNPLAGRTAGLKDLKDAKDNFERVLEVKDLPDVLRERALYGLAVTTETLSGENPSEAVARWQDLLKAYPESIYKAIAERSIKRLQTQSSKDFYAFLASAERGSDPLKKPSVFKDPKIRKLHEPFMKKQKEPLEEKIELPNIPVPLTRDLDEESKPFPGKSTGKKKESGAKKKAVSPFPKK